MKKHDRYTYSKKTAGDRPSNLFEGLQQILEKPQYMVNNEEMFRNTVEFVIVVEFEKSGLPHDHSIWYWHTVMIGT